MTAIQCRACNSNAFHVKGKLSDLRRALGKVARYPGSTAWRVIAENAKTAYDDSKRDHAVHKATHEGAT